MLTKTDKKYITETLKETIKENNHILIKEIIELFNTTNERIDKVLDQLKDHNDFIDTHERRIEKLEEKVFVI